MTPLFDIRDLAVDLHLPRSLPEALAALIRPGPRRRLNLLEGISLTLNRGETLGLVGESGSGKTTLARAMLGITPVSGGEMRFQGLSTATAAGQKALRAGTAMMFQDPVGSLSPRMRISDLVTEPLVIQGLLRKTRAAMAETLLARVGLSPALAARYPHELSGGQARRVCTARALALNPALVIADEPTAGLDVSVQGEIINLMTGLQREAGLSFLIITHNLSVIRHTADRLAILYLGRLMETGPAAAIFARPLHPYTASLIASEPDPDPRRRRKDLALKGEIPGLLRRPAGCVFHSRCPRAEALCAKDIPDLREIAPGRSVRCHFAGQ